MENMDETIKIKHPELSRIFSFQTTGMIPPNRIAFGFGSIEQIGADAATLAKDKTKTALIISDRMLKELKILDAATSSLSLAGFLVEAFTEVQPEPHIDAADALYDRYLEQEFSVVVGLGGGSVMDVAKVIAHSLGSVDPPRKYFEQNLAPQEKGVPLILVPTTSGTGSEVSPYVLLNIGHEKHFLVSPFYYPDIAIIDPLLTVSMTPSVTAYTGVDALSHAIEGMLHMNANPLSDSLCLAGIEMIGIYLKKAVADGKNQKARYYMSMAATLSMMGMSMSGPLYAHSVSYVMPMYKSTPHGVGCALALPYAMAFNLPVRTSKLARIAIALGEKTSMLSEHEAAKLAVASVARLIKDVGLPVTLAEYGGIEEGELEKMAAQMIELYPRPMNPRPMTHKESITFWHNMWNGLIEGDV